MIQLSPQHRRVAVDTLLTLVITGVIFLRATRAITGGDFVQPLEHAQLLLAQGDPLAIPPPNASSIPYPLTASTLLILFVWAPPALVSLLVIMSAVLACRLLTALFAPQSPWWAWLLLLLYLPLIFNLTLIQWGPPLLLGLAAGWWLERKGWYPLAGLAWTPLLTKAQLVPILAVPLGATLLFLGRWRALAAAIIGWLVLLGASLLLRPGWPLVWWEQTRPYTGGYSAVVVAVPWIGIPLLLAVLALAVVAWQKHNAYLLLSTLIIAASLGTPQRAIYEAAALILPISYLLRHPRSAMLVIGASWLILLQPLLRITPDMIMLLTLYAPLIVGLWVHTTQASRYTSPNAAA